MSFDQQPYILLKANAYGSSVAFEAMHAHKPRLFEHLKEIGVYGVEVSILSHGDRETDQAALAQLMEWVRPWHDAGLHVYVHPYTKGLANPSQCTAANSRVVYDAFRAVADTAVEVAALGGAPIVLTYHAAELGASDAFPDPRQHRDLMLQRSSAFFGFGYGYLEQFDGQVLLVSETQLPTFPDELAIRTGDRPDEVVKTIGNQAAGVCWDTGHYLLSVERAASPLEPTPEFVATVTHMHIHDVVDGQDHRALRPDSTHVAHYVGLAAANGRLRSITLEYDYSQNHRTATGADGAGTLRHLEEAVALTQSWSQR